MGEPQLVWRPRKWRVVLGFVVAPFASSVVLALYSVLLLHQIQNLAWSRFLPLLALSYLSSIFLGIPFYFMIRRWIWTWWVPVLAGAAGAIVVVGLILGIAVAAGRSSAINPIYAVAGFAATAVSGAVGGLSFWIVATLGERRKSPAESVFA